uniref:Transposable element P transposase n=1 Tax=Amphimedon queenslandica TaxID=400682 RepID=A0A1X7VIA3_AMPQE
MHRDSKSKDNFVHKVINHFADDHRQVFFFSDVSHLLKTTRNCLANSYAHKKSRQLWCNGSPLSWQPIMELYEKNKGQISPAGGGLFKVKLKYEHVHLNLEKHELKKYCYPYRTANDDRLKWLAVDFIGYLDNWNKSVMERDGFSEEEKKKMFT